MTFRGAWHATAWHISHHAHSHVYNPSYSQISYLLFLLIFPLSVCIIQILPYNHSYTSAYTYDISSSIFHDIFLYCLIDMLAYKFEKCLSHFVLNIVAYLTGWKLYVYFNCNLGIQASCTWLVPYPFCFPLSGRIRIMKLLVKSWHCFR